MPSLRKTHFANAIEPGASFTTIFLLDSASQGKTKTGSPYWALTLTDKTGSVEARKWDREIGDAVVGEYCVVKGSGEEYQGKIQIKVEAIRALKPGEQVDSADFLPQSPYDREQQRQELLDTVRGFNHDGLRAICEAVIDDEFCSAPAGKQLHHAYVGGLLAHVCSLVKLALGIAAHYGSLNDELLVAACIFHDAGKVKELSWEKSIGYTLEGSLIGHVSMSLEALRFLLPVYLSADGDRDTYLHLMHIIASHHGDPEKGAAKRPMTREAAAFHQLDMLDSRMGIFDVVERDEAVDGNRLTGKIWAFDGTPVWVPRQPEKTLVFVGGPNVPGVLEGMQPR